MNIIDRVFDPSTATVYPDLPAPTSQTMADAQRAKNDPEFALYRDSMAFSVDKGFEAHAYENQGDAAVEVTQYFYTAEEAAAFSAQFPKSVRFRTSTLRGSSALPEGGRQAWDLYSAQVRFHLQSNGVTGVKNETSIKRFASFVKTVEKLGLTLNWTYPYSNSISYAQLQAHLS